MNGNDQPDVFPLIAEHYPGLMLVIAVESEAILYTSAAWRHILNCQTACDLTLKDIIHADDYRITLVRIQEGMKDQQTVKFKHRIQQATYSVETEFVPLPGGCVLAISTDTTGADRLRWEEREQLARELHDGLSQTLFSASMIAETLPTIIHNNPEQTLDGLKRLVRMSKGALAELRSLLVELRPSGLAELRLSTSLSYLVDTYAIRTQAEIHARIANEKCQHPAPVKINVYRIAQESMNNIVRHARAKNVTIAYDETPESIRLEIKDDGRGFDYHNVTSSHLGLRFMYERAQQINAHFSIMSPPGEGTTVILEWDSGG